MRHQVAIEPSILSADFANLGSQAKEAEDAGVEGIQIDVMDGHFVPNLTFGPGVVKALRANVKLFLDAHLMIDNPHVFIGEFIKAGANRIIVHQEVCKDLPSILSHIRDGGVEAGVAINPQTSIQKLNGVLKMLDCVQIMTVNPGFAGQRFMEDQLEKIQALRKELDSRHSDVQIVVDGGIDQETAPLAVRAGASILVAGSSIFNRFSSVSHNVKLLRNSVDRALTPVGSSRAN